MRLNQALPDLDAGWTFYTTLGLVPIVDARPDYVRFVCPDGQPVGRVAFFPKALYPR
jgi:hypothetical protein